MPEDGTVVHDDFLGVMPFEKLITLLSTLSTVYSVPALAFSLNSIENPS